MARYKLLLDSDGVLEVSSGKSIPNDPANRDWQEYQLWRQGKMFETVTEEVEATEMQTVQTGEDEDGNPIFDVIPVPVTQMLPVEKIVDNGFGPQEPEPAETPEEEELRLTREEISSLRKEVLRGVTWLFELSEALFQVGRSKGVWQASDFPAELRDKTANYKQKLNRLKEIGGMD